MYLEEHRQSYHLVNDGHYCKKYLYRWRNLLYLNLRINVLRFIHGIFCSLHLYHTLALIVTIFKKKQPNSQTCSTTKKDKDSRSTGALRTSFHPRKTLCLTWKHIPYLYLSLNLITFHLQTLPEYHLQIDCSSLRNRSLSKGVNSIWLPCLLYPNGLNELEEFVTASSCIRFLIGNDHSFQLSIQWSELCSP